MGANSSSLKLDLKRVSSIEESAPADKSSGSGPAYRTKGTKPVTKYEGAESAWDLFLQYSKKFDKEPRYGTRQVSASGVPGDYKWSSYGDVLDKVKTMGAGIKALDLLKPDATGEMSIMGLIGVNTEAWVVTEYGVFANGGTTVPFYTSHTADDFTYAINLMGIETFACMDKFAEVLLACKPDCPTLKTLICLDKVDKKMKARFEEGGLTLLSYKDVMKAGKEAPVALEDFPGCEADQVWSFVWTSGSSGRPKAVMLTHTAFLANVKSAVTSSNSDPITEYTNKDIYLSFLPIGHIMERSIQTCIASVGARVAFFRGTREVIMEDLAFVRPTIFAGVPRLLNKVYDNVLFKVAEGGKEKIFNKALQAKVKNLHSSGQLAHPIWDRLIFNKLAKTIGLDRVHLIVTGSAPVHSSVLDFFRVVFRTPVMEGYGLSEVSSGCAQTSSGDLEWGQVGTPSPWAEIKLVSVPSMKYLYTDTKHGDIPCQGRGEICIRGPCVFSGYYKQPEKTAEVIDKDGWFHSGDIGMWSAAGKLVIIDRMSNIFKLSIGEYVAPEKVENALIRSKWIASCFVHGDTMRDSLVAIVCPDPDFFVPWGIKQGLIPEGSKSSDADVMKKLCGTKEAYSLIMGDIKNTQGLARFEIPKAIFIEPVGFDPSTGILTGTLKLRRAVAKEMYADKVEELYASLASKKK